MSSAADIADVGWPDPAFAAIRTGIDAKLLRQLLPPLDVRHAAILRRGLAPGRTR